MNEDLMFITLDYYVKVIGKDAEDGTLEKNVSDAIEMLLKKYYELRDGVQKLDLDIIQKYVITEKE